MTYPELAAAIGTTYGGSASAPRVPDLIGRVVVGVDGAGTRIAAGQADLLGDTGGVEANSQVPSHAHTITNEPAHQHSLVAACSGTSCSNANDGFTRGSGGLDSNSFRAGAAGAHSHGGATGSTGATAVTNLQPFLGVPSFEGWPAVCESVPKRVKREAELQAGNHLVLRADTFRFRIILHLRGFRSASLAWE